MKNNEWNIQHTRELFELCDSAKANGKSLMSAFKTMSERSGRSVNSVRNFYYNQARTFELVPEIAKKLGIAKSSVRRERFERFGESEVRELVEAVLVNKARGISVRRTIYDMADNDPKKALRLQNKYRSVIKTHRELVTRIIADARSRGLDCAEPYRRTDGDNFAKLTEYIASLEGDRIGKFLSILEKQLS